MGIKYIFENSPPPGEWFKVLAQAINNLNNGRSSNVGTFTLTANVASTVVSDNLFESNQVVIWSPTTANAAAALATTYVSARAKGSFTLTHTNDAQVDRTFLYVRVG